ncbi:MAG TPA: PilC/PilY family type IV pilus protein, partial [Stenomitos sp.]
MMTSRLKKYMAISLACAIGLPLQASAADYGGLSKKPLVGSISAAPLVLLTMQRDGRIFYDAYDNASDINGDGILDTKYKPALQQYKNGIAQTDDAGKPVIIDYYGYFDSYKCYKYQSYSYKDSDSKTKTVSAFVAIGDTDTGTKKCTSYTKDTTGLTGPWSGDFLNYITTSRADAIRKVLYGGKRYIDVFDTKSSTSTTVLERANIPQDTHSFGKEYLSVAFDGYDIADYTPLSAPAAGKRHLFANVTLGASSDNNPPLLRIAKDNTHRIWDWLNSEFDHVASSTEINGDPISPTDLNVRVVVCKSDQLPQTGDDKTFGYCKAYGSGSAISYKPIGVLHKYGEKDSIYFGLLTGSFKKNLDGGVLRKAISSFSNEVNTTTGQFIGSYSSDSATVKGIVYTLDRLQAMPFTGPGSAFKDTAGETNGTDTDKSSWTVGNPVAEMMYEGLRYFAGSSSPTSAYWDGSSLDSNNLTSESPKLPAVLTWSNPYSTYSYCSKPTQMLISDVTPTFDSDKLPGSPWAAGVSFSDTFGSLDVNSEATKIWESEKLGTKNIIIGEKYGDSTDVGMPTAKSKVSSLGGIRGLPPMDPQWQGSYYTASVAKFGKETSLKTLGNSAFSGTSINDRTVNTSAIALSAAAPQILIPYEDSNGNKTTISIVPYAQTGSWDSKNPWKFAELIKLYVDNIKNVPGAESDNSINNGNPYYKFQVVFSDNSLYANYNQDNDMDVRATYEVYLDPATAKVYVNVCADPNPGPQTDNSLTSAEQDIRCKLDGNDGLGYSATGVRVMHLGYTITGVDLKDGKSTHLVVRNNSFFGSPSEQRHPLDLPDALVGGTFVDNYWNGTNATSSLTTYPVASDGKSLRLNNQTIYSVSTSASTSEFIPHDPLWYAAKFGGYAGNDSTAWAGSDGVTPRSYFQVVNPASLRDQLDAALKQESDTSASGTAAAVNGQKVSTATTVYQATYETKTWSGHLYAYGFDNQKTSLSTGATWDAALQIPSAGSRNIYTYRLSSLSGIPFTWSGLNKTEQAELANQSSYLDYLRGDRSKEGTGSSNYRVRATDTVLGDIINSQPLYVGTGDLGYASTLTGDEALSYSNFVTWTKSKRIPMLYAGANDGMMHGFSAVDGTEKFAYIPRALLFGENASRLSDLVSKTYSHEYYVDGPSASSDFYDGKNWKTALVGTLGAGGRAIFALDVTDPGNFGSKSVMWEFTHPELGYVINPPVFARLPDGNWYVIVGNGLESNTCDSSVTPRYATTSSGSPLPACNTLLATQTRNAKLFIIKLAPDLT